MNTVELRSVYPAMNRNRPALPLVTLALVLANLLAFSLENAVDGERFCATYGLIPARFMRTWDLGPVFFGMFLHDPANLVHIGGNMLFLAVFGTLVERSFGGFRFLVLYLFGGCCGGLLHVLVDPTSTLPLVGASGAIFGILAVAAVQRPRLLGFVGAFLALNIWYALTGAGGGVSFGDHIGGFAGGFLAVALIRTTRSSVLEAA